MKSIRLKAAALAAVALAASAQVAAAPKIYVNEFYRAGTLGTAATGTDEWLELVLIEDLTAAQLEGFFFGDSTGTTAAKFSGYRLQNLAAIAPTFPKGTIIVIAGTSSTAAAADSTYDPANGDWNLTFKTSSMVGNGSTGDFAGSDVAYIDTNGTNLNATLSADGFMVNWHATPGVFGQLANVTIPAPANNTGAQLTGDLAGIATASNWASSVAAASLSPGLPNGNANTTSIDALRATLVVPPSLSIDDVSEIENAACVAGKNDFSFTVTATPAPADGETVTFTASTADPVAGNVATAGVDYDAIVDVAGSIVGPAATTTVTVQVNCDTSQEPDETFDVVLDDIVGGTPGDVTGVGTIQDDDSRALTIADVNIVEGDLGGLNAEFIITLSSPAPAGGITYDIGVASGTALKDDDYGDSGTVDLVIAEGQTTATFLVPIIGELESEPNETFVVNVSNVRPAIEIDFANSDFQAIGTIINDDGLAIADASITEGDAGTATLDFTVSLKTAAPAGGVTFDIATADGTATAGADYVANALNGQVIPEGSTSYTFSVQVNGDTAFESNETFAVNVTNVVGVFAVDTSATGTINDNDAGGSLGDATANEGDVGNTTGNLVFTLTRALASPATITVSTTGGTATAGVDYVAQAGVVVQVPAGATTVDVPVTIIGDFATDNGETVIVTVTAADPRITLDDATGTLTINDDDVAPIEIHDIQGSGLRSPFAPPTGELPGAQVFTQDNVVTGIANDGFIMQAPANRADANPLTSEGIYVFTGSAPTVTVGQLVTVKGTAAEFFNMTQISNATVVPGGAGTLPPAVVFDQDTPSRDPANLSCGPVLGNFECFEGMLVTAVGIANTGNQTFGSDPVAEIYATAVGTRARREKGVRFGLTPPAGVPVWDGNPEVFELDANKLDRTDALPDNPQITGGTLFEATGIIGFDFGNHELWPTALELDPKPLENPMPAAGTTELTIGSYNVLRLCVTANCNDDVAPTPAQIATKVARVSDYIISVMRTPDVVGVQEVETLALLQQLAARISADGGPTYLAYLVEGNDPGGIDNGFLVRGDRIANIGVWQLGKAETITDCSGNPAPATCAKHDRPPLLLRGRYVANGADFTFAVMNNHTRSRNGVDTGSAADVARVRAKRFAQGQSIATFVQRFQTGQVVEAGNTTGLTGTADMPLFLVGDYNAFEVTDGWADVVGLIAGTYDDAENLLKLNGPNIVNPPLLQTSTTVPLEQRYSYVFAESFGNIQAQSPRRAGAVQILDHGFANVDALPFFKRMAYGNTNADAPAVLINTGTDGVGSSDHDGFVLYVETGDALFSDSFE